MNRLPSKLLALVLLCLASPAALLAAGKGTPTFYDRHVIFDNSRSDGGYASSSGWLIAPSALELVDGTVPVETKHFVSPPNALRLAWTSAPDRCSTIRAFAEPPRARPRTVPPPGPLVCSGPTHASRVSASVKARELRFEEEPQTEVRFWGSPKRNSVPVNERKNLPEQVQQGVTHRNVSVQSRIASELVAPEEEPYATTAAREKAQRLRVELQTVSGSGADGRITYKDVSRAAQG